MSGRRELLDILAHAQTLGFLGPGDPAEHLAHAAGFAGAARELGAGEPARFADLGTGGGVPGLVLALEWSEAHGSLIESSARRCRALEEWVDDLDLADRLEVVEGRAEEWAHADGIRESFDLVTARSFARPSVTAEIAAGLVKVGGFLLVSEPPTPDPRRWPADALERLGFGPALPILESGAHYAGLHKAGPAPAGTPRGVGRPAKRPLW